MATGATAPKSGLGQRIIAMMASKLGARIDQDHTHKGTRFVISVPAKLPAEDAMPDDQPADEKTGTKGAAEPKAARAGPAQFA